MSFRPSFQRRDAWSLALMLLASVATGCRLSPEAQRAAIEPVYSPDTGELILLRYDENRNGIAETQSHMRGTQIVRIDVDADEDGRVDRWEHYGADRRLLKVGFSRARDGREDTWSFADASGAILRIEVATPGTDNVTRTEHYEGGALVRAEEDSDGDGAIDRWETYEGGRLARLAFDTAHVGVPTRILAYQPDGSVQVETLKPTLDRRR